MIKYKYKDFEKELAVIKYIESLDERKVVVGVRQHKAHITKSKKDFHFVYNGIFPYSTDKKLDICIDGILYTIKSSDFIIPEDERLTQIPCKNTFDIDSLLKGSLNNRRRFRMFFFDNSDRSNIFHYKLESPKYDGKIPWAFDCVRLEIKKKRYDIVQYKYNGQSYFVIENLDPVGYNIFRNDSYAIQKGIGFLVGYMPGGENYIFSGDNFVYERLARQALKSIYHPVTTNPYSYVLLQQKKLAKNYESKLKVIPSSVISNFVSQIRENDDMSVAIIFLMEVASLKSVVSMPGAFSVILESLANVIINKQEIKENLITDKILAKKMIGELKAVVNKYATDLHPDAMLKIKRRLAAINHPIDIKKITNKMKLREPFDQLGIGLSELDELAIDYRNDLLHGNILMNNGIDRTSKEIDDHMLYISAKLFTLISKLVLKNAGYSGFVINHAKFYDYANAVAEQEYFELI